MKSVGKICAALAICFACSGVIVRSELTGEIQAELAKSVQSVKGDGVDSDGTVSNFKVRTRAAMEPHHSL